MIPICLVTGFLGSGKTTLLKNLAARHQDQRIVYLVNDFAQIDVDGPLLEEAGQAAVAIAGGSIFCKCLVTDFIHQLRDIHQGVCSDGVPPDGLVIEASGMADPRVVEQMLQETKLNEQYALSSILTILDPGRFIKLIHTLPNIKAQVEAADIVIINKQDLYDPELLEQCRDQLTPLLRDGANVLHAEQARVELNIFGTHAPRELEGRYAECADPNYASFSLMHPTVTLATLLEELSRMEPMIYRAKGYLRIEGAWHYIEYEGNASTARDCTDAEPEHPGLAIIAKGNWSAEVEQRIARLSGKTTPRSLPILDITHG